jgi:hypothetical protein
LRATGPYLIAWEIWAGLDRHPGEFEFSYERCDIVERPPRPGAAIGSVAATAYAQATAAIRIDRGTYPSAPDHFKACENVKLMYGEYKQYREGKWKLAPFAYLSYDTIIEMCQKQTSLVEKKFGIDRELLRNLSNLSSEKGGRKYKGASKEKELTREETQLLEQMVKAIIRRAGEVAGDPARKVHMITMDNLWQV